MGFAAHTCSNTRLCFPTSPAFMPSCLLSLSLSLSLGMPLLPSAPYRTLGLPHSTSAAVLNTELTTKWTERSWPMHDMFLCFPGLAEQLHVLNQQLSCTQMFNYRNGGPNRDAERHSEICTVYTCRAVTPSVRPFIGRAELRIAPPSKYTCIAIDEGQTTFRVHSHCTSAHMI